MTGQRQAFAATIAVGVALLAGLWFLAVGPKRSEKAQVDRNLAAQQARLDAATANVAAFTASRKQFPGLLTELRDLDRAVPARGGIAAMLRELQRRAKARDSDLRLVALNNPGQAGPETTRTTPGAITGPAGLSALPFTFEYTGAYFDLLDILKAVRRSVRATSDDLDIDGRLLTIDGVSFRRVHPDAPLTKAVLNATAYVAPDGATAPHSPAPAPDPAAPAPGTALRKGW